VRHTIQRLDLRLQNNDCLTFTNVILLRAILGSSAHDPLIVGIPKTCS
jgi:hypothetical protein